MKGMCWLLLLCAAASAQPVFGPYEVYQLPEGRRLSDVRLVIHNDTCEIAFAAIPTALPQMHDSNSSIGKTAFFMETRLPAGTADSLVEPDGWTWQIDEVFADETGKWAISAYGTDRFNEATGFYRGQGPTRTAVFYNAANGIGELVLNADTLDFYECDMGVVQDVTISRIGGGYWVLSRYWGCQWFGFFGEPWATNVLHRLNNAFEVEEELEYCDPSCQAEYGPWWTTGYGIDADSVVLLSRNSHGYTLTCLADQLPVTFEVSCLPEQETRAKLFPTAPGSAYMVLGAEIYQVLYDGGCNHVGSYPFFSSSNALNFNRYFGFASVDIIPGYLVISRTNGLGQEAQPPGVLYETDGTSFIVDADVTITDDGKVVCVWSEYSDWGEGPRVIKIAWVDWATYLDSADENTPQVPREFALSAYPNPFNASVTISFDLPQSGEVALRVFDLQGRLVTTLFDERFAAGEHNVSWSPENLSSGVYFAQLTSAQSVRNTKLLYLK